MKKSVKEARLQKTDNEDLRVILEAQEERQQRLVKIFTAIGPTAFPASAAEFITNSLSTRLPEFIDEPGNGCRFDVWFNRYEDVITKDGSALD
ncbi:unnamed protein product [Toxocara canis]|uniref:DUF7083 domain-containing protein n=1 Tax=Toxocara canis TaxID=6265 RepID=A0A183U216_TOXCA|nr:unnamed protein product [Toxocara canis]